MRWLCLLYPLIVLWVSGCRRAQSDELPPEWLVSYVQRTDEPLRAVDPSNGIDAREAVAIAGVYMVQFVSGCGAPDEAHLQGNTWVVELRLGLTGRKSDRTIEVDSRNGAVWGLGGPRYRDFQSFRYGVLTQIARNGH
jgi:hypothetical protein